MREAFGTRISSVRPPASSGEAKPSKTDLKSLLFTQRIGRGLDEIRAGVRGEDSPSFVPETRFEGTKRGRHELWLIAHKGDCISPFGDMAP